MVFSENYSLIKESPNSGGFSGTDADAIEALAGANSAGLGEGDCCVRAIDRAADILPASNAKVIAILQLAGMSRITLHRKLKSEWVTRQLSTFNKLRVSTVPWLTKFAGSVPAI